MKRGPKITLFAIAALVAVGLLVGGLFFRHLDLAMRPEKKACRGGNAAACLAVGNHYTEITAARGVDKPLAQEFYEKSCDLGSEDGCFKLGEISFKGGDQVFSYPKQMKGYIGACTMGRPDACRELGLIYYSAPGRPHDVKLAAGAFRRGCVGSDVVACYWTAMLIERGEGVPADRPMARGLLEHACQRGYAPACNELKR